MVGLIILFILLFMFWFILSGITSVFFITIGLVSSFIAVLFYKIIYKDKTPNLAKSIFRLFLYSFYLIKEITKSSFNIGLRMWKLEPEISPQIQWIKTDLENNIMLTIFANSITLTPGTVTVDIKDNNSLYVHSLTSEGIQDLETGTMLTKIKKFS